MRLVFFPLLMFLTVTLTAHSQFSIKGKVSGSDDDPPQFAHVHIQSNAPSLPRSILKSTLIQPDGTFALTLSKPGLYRLYFTAVDHHAKEIPVLLIDTSVVNLYVRLKRYEFVASGSIQLIGDFNNFSFRNGVLQMAKQPDGTFAVEVACNNDSLAYQILGAERTGRSVNGTQSDDFAYDGGGDYRSIVKVHNGKVLITFDPRRYSKSAETEEVSFLPKSSLAARFFRFSEDIETRRLRMNEAFNQHRKSGSPTEFAYDWSEDISEIELLRDHEEDPLIKRSWLLAKIYLQSLKTEKEDAVLALSEIPPDSPLWSYSPVSPAICTQKLPKDERLQYLIPIIEKHPDAEIKPFLIEGALSLLKAQGRDSLFMTYYSRLLLEFPKSPWTRTVKARFSPERNIQPGKLVPDFSISALDDSTVTISRENLLGKIYLIDSWATWCGPCVGEMKYLHEAHKRFSQKGLVILSVSFDFKSQDINHFRQQRWPMPWLHSYIKDGPDSEFAKQFEVLTIPKPILVNKDGIIIATQETLRGETLLQTLSQVFADD